MQEHLQKTLFGFSMGRAAAEFLDSLPPGKMRRQVTKKAYSLITNPRPAGCKKLQGVMDGGYPVWRIRSGDYRILYVVRESEVLVIDIDNRKDVYR